MQEKQLSIFDRPAKPEKVTQGQKILDYMKQFGSITPMEAFRDLGVMRLGARIYDLEQQGVKIIHERETSKNRMGENTTYSRYRLEA